MIYFLLLLLFLLSLSVAHLRFGSLNPNGRSRVKFTVKRNLAEKVTVFSFSEVEWGICWKGQCYLSHGTKFSSNLVFFAALFFSVLSTLEVINAMG